MNTTPLVDVLLVLLIMLIFTFPVASHSTAVDLPHPPHDRTLPQPDPTKNVLVLDRDGELQWNAQSISEAELTSLLAQVRAMSPEPEVQFRPDADTSYERSARVILIVKQSRITRFGFVGNERYRTFSRN